MNKIVISVLYVDDESILLDVTKIYLERDRDFSITTSNSAADALTRISAEKFDLIISDYQMPEIDGIEFLKIVRNIDPKIPFILFTGRGREEVVIEAINSGADFYLQKGGDPRTQFAELAHKARQAVNRYRAEHSLRESEKRLSDIINFLPDATFAIDLDRKVIAWNKAIEEMTGVSSEDILGKGDYEYSLPFYGTRRSILIDIVFESDEKILKNYKDIHHVRDTYIAETDLSHLQGKHRTLMAKSSPLYNEKGEITGAIESIRDITEQKMAEEELRAANQELTATEEELRTQYYALAQKEQQIRESENRIRQITETVPGVVYQFYAKNNGELGLYFVTERSMDIFGIKNDPDDFFPRFFEHVHPSDKSKFSLSIDNAVRSLSSWDYIGRFVKSDGTLIWFHGKSVPNKNKDEIIFTGVITDITEQKKMEETVHSKESMFQAVFDYTEAATIIIEDDMTIFLANDAFSKLLGRPRQEIEGKLKWTDFVSEKDIEVMKDRHYNRRLGTEKIPNIYEFAFIDVNGKSHDILTHVGTIPGTKRSVASLLDITTIKRRN